MNASEIRMILDKNGIAFRKELPELLQLYLDMLTDWNSRMDLTAITEDAETVDRHFIDSLIVLKTDLMEQASSLIDVGTGAGFPGMVIALACPGMQVSLLDSQQKRLRFLEAVTAAAGAAGSVGIIYLSKYLAASSYLSRQDMAMPPRETVIVLIRNKKGIDL